MEITALIQYILTAAQSFGYFTNYYNKFLKMILGLAGVLFCKNEQTNGLLFVPKKILACVLREAGGGLKAATGKRETTLLPLYPHSFLLLSAQNYFSTF